ncbi:Rho GTPase [Pseudocyphellaria aurata]|nr:Rho GTPase [Pseudocyphellaria aurata]
MATVQLSDNYDYLRRQGSVMSEGYSSKTGSISPRRKPVRQQSARGSNGTISTANSMSTGGKSLATNVTQPPSYSKKFVVVGDGGCGKTCLFMSYTAGRFPEKYVPTVFENYFTETLHAGTGKTVELALWDTAGQEEYDRLRPLSYPETDLLFVCFAIDCPNSLENVMDTWYPEVAHFCPETPIILLGLKSDLRTKRTCIDLLNAQGLTPVTPEQGQGVAKKMKAMYMECSSKEMQGVDEVFELAVNEVVRRHEEKNRRDEEEKQQQKDSQQRYGGGGKSKQTKKGRNCPIL